MDEDARRAQWRHSHTFGQDAVRPGESRTRIVIAVTAAMMVVEIATGILFGSMALLADGLHMASHAAALSISAFAYVYARRNADSPEFSFGTGKVNALGGFSGAILLAVFALIMAWESFGRLLQPVPIVFDQAILVAVVGLVVNGASIFILGGGHHGHEHHGFAHAHGHDHTADGDHGHGDAYTHEHTHDHAHGQDHTADGDHGHGAAHTHDHAHGQDHTADGDHGHDAAHTYDHEHGQDHNLRSAYLHVIADALTSVLAIFALVAAKFFGFVWMDPAMGILGAVLVARWSLGLLRTTSAVLLDRQGPMEARRAIEESVESDGHSWVSDLHLWSIGPGLFAAVVSVVSREPESSAAYRARFPSGLGLVHVSVEVNSSEDAPSAKERRTVSSGTRTCDW